MAKSISILGCGWLGLPLAKRLIISGHTVKGSTTTQEKIEKIEAEGIQAFKINIEGLESNISEFLKAEILIILITSKSIDAFSKLIQKIKSSDIQKIIYISSTSVYDANNSMVTEQTPTNDSPIAQIEALFRSSFHFQSTILRFAGLFGYDRQPGNFIKTDRAIANPEGFVNLIHQDDCVEIIMEIIRQNAWRDTFNACTDDHPKRRDFYLQERDKVNREACFDEKATNSYKIVSNKKLKEKLKYSFQYAQLLKGSWP